MSNFSRNRVLLPLLILFLASLCLVSCEALGIDNHPTSTRDVLITASPTPPPVYSFPLQPLSGEVTNFATYETNIQDIPPGIYILTSDLSYFSLEGIRLGILVNLTPAELTFSDGLPSYRLRDDPQLPILYIIYYSSQDDGGQILVQKLDLKSGETSAWQVDLRESLRAIHQMGKIRCEDPYLSPSGRWLAGECEVDKERYIYVLDQENMSGRLLRTPSGPCQAECISDTYWRDAEWSPDEAWLFVRCRTRGCLISMESGEFTCREPLDSLFYGWSPDGSKVALMGDENAQTNVPGCLTDPNVCDEEVLYVADADCLIDEHACNRYASADLGGYFFSTIWESTGSSLIWSEFPLIVTESGLGPGFSKIGIMDIDTGETSLLADLAPKGLSVTAFSPDQKWIILHDDQGGIWKFILERKSFRRLFQEPGYSYFDFLGWMEIP